MIAETRAQGYSFNDGRIIAGMSAVGVPVFDHLSRPSVSLSCAAIADRMGPERRASIVDLLLKEAKTIALQLNPQASEQTLSSVTGAPNRMSFTAEG
jgi:DNA-binding IclR family transcriptional regulator